MLYCKIRWPCGCCFNICQHIRKWVFGVKVKILKIKSIIVPVLKQANQTITEAYLKDLGQEKRREGIRIKKLFRELKMECCFNISRGRTSQIANSVNFNFEKKVFQNVQFIKTQKTRFFDNVAIVKWPHNIKRINSPKIKDVLREDALHDDSGGICLSIFGKGYRIYLNQT